MPNEPAWLDLDELFELNQLIVDATGEPFNVRDAGLLESAYYNPVNLHLYEDVDDVVTLAVALMLAIARNHPFEQGNKRTGFEAALIFLERNGYDVELPDETWFAHFLVMAITGELPPEVLEDELRQFVLPTSDL